MKNTIKLTVAAIAIALFGSAHASTINISTGLSFAGAQGTANGYRSVVDAAVGVATPGYGSSSVAVYDNISNNGLFGSANDIAFKSTVTFNVSAADVGNWEFRSGVDFGSGGAIFVDGVALDTKTNDMWWNGSYSDPSQYFDVSLFLTAGNHTLNIYGLEHCCDGPQQAQFRGSGEGFTTFSNADGLNSVVPEPASVALMLGGLALIGFTTRRKSMKK